MKCSVLVASITIEDLFVHEAGLDILSFRSCVRSLFQSNEEKSRLLRAVSKKSVQIVPCITILDHWRSITFPSARIFQNQRTEAGDRYPKPRQPTLAQIGKRCKIPGLEG